MDRSKTSQYIIRWNRSRIYWWSGPWNEEKKIFSSLPEMTLNYIYNFSYVTNDKESYFTYTVKNNSIVSRLVMNQSGQVQQLTWLDSWFLFWSQPKSHCVVYSLCGPFGSCSKNELPYCSCFKGLSEASPNSWALEDRSGGCVRNASLQCGDKDWFYAMNHVKVPDNAQSLLSALLEVCKSVSLPAWATAHALLSHMALVVVPSDMEVCSICNICHTRTTTRATAAPYSSALQPLSCHRCPTRRKEVSQWLLVLHRWQPEL